MKNIFKNTDGQALIFVVLTLLVVFFIAISVSEGLSRDAVSTLHNQDSEQAYNFAKTAMDAATNYLKDPSSNLSDSITKDFADDEVLKKFCTNNQNGISSDAHCVYTITPLDNINQPLQKNIPIQITIPEVGGSFDITLKNFDTSSLLILHFIIEDNSGFSNKECVVLRSDYIGGNGMPDISKMTGCVLMLEFDSATNTYVKKDIKIEDSKTKYIRILPFTKGSFANSNILVNMHLTGGVHPIQEYRIVATGEFNGSRRTIEDFYNVNGTVPGLFDYVLFNNSSIPVSYQ